MTKIFVTAEIGTSWQGDLEVLRNMLDMCKISGVDAVKFQCLSKKILDRHKEINYYEKASLNEENIYDVAELCDEFDLEFYSTVTYPECIEWLNIHVEKYKIRTLDNDKIDLIERCFETGKQVIISSLRPLSKRDNMINLYCIPRYPVNLFEINFDLIKNFDGYSNHCKDALAILIPRNIMQYLEFHITPSLDWFSLDNSVSFSLVQMAEIMKILRQTEIE